jgi:AcrR family transcriptional regulator
LATPIPISRPSRAAPASPAARLYHHFKDKQDLFSAVFDLEEQKLTSIVAQAAVSQAGAFDGMLAGCNAFLDACLDPAVQRIVLIDALAVLGWERWREIDTKYNLRLVMGALEAAWIKASSRAGRSSHWRIC